MKIRVGFIVNYNLDKWLGITYYYQNLFKTILDQEKREIELVLITDSHMTKEEEDKFKNIEIIKSDLFDRKLNRWKVYLDLMKILIFGKNEKIQNFLLKNNIDIISHTSILGRKSKIPSIKYIPDFQELYYPEYFNWKLILKRKLMLWWALNNSNRILLYSESIKKDMNKIFKLKNDKVSFLPYCSNINSNELVSFEDLKIKYKIQENFFYLPNHFWKHKNHITVYKSIEYLKNNGNQIYLVTTGEKSDYRNPEYIKELDNYISNNNLNKNINHLGIIPMREVYSLIKYCKAIINPSFFEGWGTSVEHARYFKKHVIASNIQIHLEQNEFNTNQKINSEHAKYYCHYFNPENHIELANLMLEQLRNDEKNDNVESYQEKHNLIVKEFYLKYVNIIKSLI